MHAMHVPFFTVYACVFRAATCAMAHTGHAFHVRAVGYQQPDLGRASGLRGSYYDDAGM